MQVAASFLSSKRIPYDLERLNMTSVDYIHVDVMDGKFVKNKTFSFRKMKNISKYTSKRLDVHLMVRRPSKYIKNYASLNTAYLTVHLKTLEDTKELIRLIHSYGIKAGLAISPNEQIVSILPFIHDIDLVLLMSVVPGEGGQDFLVETPDRLEELQRLRMEEKATFQISVDGGINDQTVSYISSDIVVSGSYLLQSPNLEEAIQSLR